MKYSVKAIAVLLQASLAISSDLMNAADHGSFTTELYRV